MEKTHENLTPITFLQNEFTGEITQVTDGVYLSQAYLDTGQEVKEYRKQQRLRNLHNREEIRLYGNFTWLRYEYDQLPLGGLSAADTVRLLYAATYLKYDDTLLQYRQGTILTPSALQREMKLSDSTFRNFCKETIQKDILNLDDNSVRVVLRNLGRCRISTWMRNPSPLIRIFHNEVRHLYHSVDARGHKQLGYLVQLIPYLRKEDNALCRNPYADETEDLVYLSMGDLCPIIGYEANQASRLLSIWTGYALSNGQQAFIYNAAKKKAVINPRLFYAGDSVTKGLAANNLFDIPQNESNLL